MPSLSLDWLSDDENNTPNENIPAAVVQYDAYSTRMDKTITRRDFYQTIMSRFESIPFTKPHTISQDFFQNHTPVSVFTSVFKSKTGEYEHPRLLKYIAVSYHTSPPSKVKGYLANLRHFMGKIMNEIRMQNIAHTLQRDCDVKVPTIYNYGEIDDGKNTLAAAADSPQFITLKRADSMDLDKKTVSMFIEMEFISDSTTLTELMRTSTKAKCEEYKAKLIELKNCLERNHFWHGDMHTTDNILVNNETGEFTLIDYGQSSNTLETRQIDKVASLSCDNNQISSKGGRKRTRSRRHGRNKTPKRCGKKCNRKTKRRNLRRKTNKRHRR